MPSTTTQGQRVKLYPCEYGPCANGGISDTVRAVTLVDGPDSVLPQPPATFHEPTEDAPAVLIVRGNLGGDTMKAVPAIADDDGVYRPENHTGRIGPMMGGAHVAPTARLFDQPVPLHDRWETTAQYNQLSR